MPRFAANLSMMFTERPFLERFGAAAAAGFRAVEYLFPYAEEAAAIRAELDRHGLEQALYNSPPGDWDAGQRGFAAVPGAEERFAEDLERALAYAAVIRPRNIHIMAGIVQGPAARATYIANLRRAATRAPEQGFVIEPINHWDMPGYHLSRTDDARGVIAEVGAPNLRLQLDLYHAQIMEGDLTRRIEALAPITAHVQMAGVPLRHEPDAGEANFPHLMATLDRTGYTGFVGCEYRPAAGTEAGLGWFAPYRDAQSPGAANPEGQA
ncbi:MAG: 2-oxo-tetronate isomerase [Pseudomonadota bacterium]